MTDILNKYFKQKQNIRKIFLSFISLIIVAWIVIIIYNIKISAEEKIFFEKFISKNQINQVFFLIITISLFFMSGYILIENKIIKNQGIIIRNTFNNMLPLCVTNTDYEIILANDAYWDIFGKPDNINANIKCFDHRPGENCRSERCPLTRVFSDNESYLCESVKKIEEKNHYFIITAKPIIDHRGKIIGITESFQEITDRKELENEKEKLLTSLRENLNKVKLLSGLIPICASCKKIRDDKGYWNQIEIYIRDHSEAEFTHGICPVCVEKYYSGQIRKAGDKNSSS